MRLGAVEVRYQKTLGVSLAFTLGRVSTQASQGYSSKPITSTTGTRTKSITGPFLRYCHLTTLLINGVTLGEKKNEAVLS